MRKKCFHAGIFSRASYGLIPCLSEGMERFGGFHLCGFVSARRRIRANSDSPYQESFPLFERNSLKRFKLRSPHKRKSGLVREMQQRFFHQLTCGIRPQGVTAMAITPWLRQLKSLLSAQETCRSRRASRRTQSRRLLVQALEDLAPICPSDKSSNHCPRSFMSSSSARNWLRNRSELTTPHRADQNRLWSTERRSIYV